MTVKTQAVAMAAAKEDAQQRRQERDCLAAMHLRIARMRDWIEMELGQRRSV